MIEADESQGRVEQPLYFDSLAAVQRSLSDPPPRAWRSPRRLTRFRGFSFPVLLSVKVLVTKLEKIMTPPVCWQYATDRLITCWHIFPSLFFFLFADSSNFNTIVENTRDGKIVWLFFFAKGLLKSKMFLEISLRWHKSPQLVRKLEWNCSKFTIVAFHLGFFSPWVPKIYIHFCKTRVSLTSSSFLQVQNQFFEI